MIRKNTHYWALSGINLPLSQFPSVRQLKYRIHFTRHQHWCISSPGGMLMAAYFGDIADAMHHVAQLIELSKLRAI